MPSEYEDEVYVEVGDEEIAVTVTYQIYGGHTPASRHSPAEYPELEVTDLSHGENADKKFEFDQVFNQKPPFDKEWKPTPGLVDYSSWESDAVEKAATQDEDDRGDYLYEMMRDREFDRYDD